MKSNLAIDREHVQNNSQDDIEITQDPALKDHIYGPRFSQITQTR